ncbi:MAG: N-6 DNA methylase [Bacteroidales bacterium]|jgi:adenine-specific DNA-methyltransferase|nr:SAM-dependent methyltransferase [Bacteroidales bacterium]MDD2203795.1 N-6 DNA methylase [Bacteroidales bacterium]MDD3913266.1 N-6 DNA methylase [Bacteroidales bacterium]MDD4633297.1 N-6 DNA methylase [Bacteroidales bacterium]
MAKAVKQHGRVYTPNYLVKIILDFGNYSSTRIISKHVIDNSCGDGAFLIEIVNRYCNEFFNTNSDISILKNHLETYIHGIELDETEYNSCINNLNKTVKKYNLSNISWDILNADTLTINKFNGNMDYVFGNHPYVRVHNLNNNYEAVKQYRFAEKGMTDLFIVFFEIGFNMLADNGTMCEITPSSWLSSNAGIALRNYITYHKNLSGLIDLEHFQPFTATTYTLISRFKKTQQSDKVEYYIFNQSTNREEFKDSISLKEMTINGQFYLSLRDNLATLQKIRTSYNYKYVSVKNGFATLADKIFIGDFSFVEGTIEILKASMRKTFLLLF